MGNLALMCTIAFVAVFLVLTVLSILMTALTAAFPAARRHAALRHDGDAQADAALTAAITTTMHRLYPGSTVARIEERE